MEKLQLNLKISAAGIGLVQSVPSRLASVISEALDEGLKRDIAELYAGSGLTPAVENISIAVTSFDNESGKGKFRMTYVLHRQFSCSDIQTTESDYIDWEFAIDSERLRIDCTSTTPLVWSSYE
ncbi:hypothetical protein [Parapedobacter koreensis]|uniref:Uncharacterized protein n=1 Tax=Parapedobacter koreensis TaxID=332977 RepID=A0A1H7UM51_9SPHI|nr:hypothetical protein [Parapedobacter koreensis]SEL97708.1 hypothetical protein SAMN05421740_1184 [Parapedobacter koreensis]